jgi:hypothetical protein
VVNAGAVASPAIVRGVGTWGRVQRAMRRHGNAEGWISRHDLARGVGKVPMQEVVDALNDHPDEVETRIVPMTNNRTREEYRLR